MKKIFVLIAVLSCTAISSFAQMSPEEDQQLINEEMALQETLRQEMESGDFSHPEVDARYPDGEQALTALIMKHIRYPKSEKEQGVQGTVGVAVVIDAEGRTESLLIENSVSRLLDSAAIDVLSNVMKWEPATKNGTAIRSVKVVPVEFKLN